MSRIAQSRDLADRRTILDFASIVQTLGAAEAAPGADRLRHPRRRPRRLERLERPASALALLRDRADPDRRVQRRLADARGWRRRARRLPERLNDWPEAERERYPRPPLSRLLAARRRGPAGPPRRFRPALPIATKLRLAFEIRPMAFEAATELTVLAPDHPRLLSVIAGACAACDANIVDAQIFTTADGRALDTVIVSRAFDNDDDEERRGKRIAKIIEQALEGRIRLDEALAGKRQKSSRREAFTDRAAGQARQRALRPFHRRRSGVPRPQRPALRPDPHDIGAEPRHRLGAYRDLRRARRRHLLRDRSRRPQTRRPRPRQSRVRRKLLEAIGLAGSGADRRPRSRRSPEVRFRLLKPPLSLSRIDFGAARPDSGRMPNGNFESN